MSVCHLLAFLRGWGHEAPPHSRLPLIPQGWNLGTAARQPAEKLDFLVSLWVVQFVGFQQEVRGPPRRSPGSLDVSTAAAAILHRRRTP